jgi:hypothetical protein
VRQAFRVLEAALGQREWTVPRELPAPWGQRVRRGAPGNRHQSTGPRSAAMARSLPVAASAVRVAGSWVAISSTSTRTSRSAHSRLPPTVTGPGHSWRASWALGQDKSMWASRFLSAAACSSTKLLDCRQLLTRVPLRGGTRTSRPAYPPAGGLTHNSAFLPRPAAPQGHRRQHRRPLREAGGQQATWRFDRDLTLMEGQTLTFVAQKRLTESSSSAAKRCGFRRLLPQQRKTDQQGRSESERDG